MARRGVFLFIVILLGLSIVNQCNIANEFQEIGMINPVKRHDVSYVTHEPFNITSDIDFEIQAWPGNGSFADPYMIENLNITCNSICIWIRNTTSYFEIRNCLFKTDFDPYQGGYLFRSLASVTLTNTTNGLVESNVFSQCKSGISVANATLLQISNNILQTSDFGIVGRNLTRTTILQNTQIIDPIALAINLISSSNCTISENRFGNVRSFGIDVVNCNSCNITGNEINGTKDEMSMPWSGIEIFGGADCSILDNIVSNFTSQGILVLRGNHIIKRNTVTESWTGIHMESDHCEVTENTLTSNDHAVQSINSNSSLVMNNTIRGGSRAYDVGITIRGGTSCNVTMNNISEVVYGVRLQNTRNLLIEQNRVYESSYGIYFGFSGWWGYLADVPDGPSFDCEIVSNSFDNGGFYPRIDSIDSWDFTTFRFEGNTIHGRPIGFIHDLLGGTLSGSQYGQLIIVNCSSLAISGGAFYEVSSDAYDWGHHAPGIATSIQLIGCTDCNLSDITFTKNTIGLGLTDSPRCSISGIEAYDNTWIGVATYASEDLTITQSHFYGNFEGLRLQGLWNTSILSSSFTGNDKAMLLVEALNCSILNNVLEENIDSIFLDDSDGCTLSFNIIRNNDRGALINSSSACLITHNTIIHNIGVGICLDESSNRNDIFNNSIGWNSPNALCEGSSNHWDNQVDTGNRWSDYSGSGPYIIDVNDQDNFPLCLTLTPTTNTPWEIYPLLLVGVGGAVAIVALVIVLIDRRRVRIID